MVYVLLALLLFCLSVMTHIIFCRVTVKSGLHAKAFILIAFLYLTVYAGLASIIQHSGEIPAQSIWGLPIQLSAAAVFVLLVPVYLCFYVLTQLMSPSKKILLSISRHGEMSHSDIVRCIQEEDFINTRLADLMTSGCVSFEEGRYRLRPSGRKVAGILQLMQSVLGREMGG